MPVGAPIALAVDDTLFRRSGRRVHGGCWAYDGSRQVAPGAKKLSRGTTFVVAAVVVELPFLDRPIALPVLARLWRPGGPTKPALAHELITMIATARRDRTIHVVADGAYVCTTLRHLPTNVTLTGPLPRHAALYEVHPDVDYPPCLRGKRGRPRTRGERLGTPPTWPPPPHGRPSRSPATATPASSPSMPSGAYGLACFAPARSACWSSANRAARTWPCSPPTPRPASSRSSNATPHAGPSKSPSPTPNNSPASARPATAPAVRSNAPSPSACSSRAW